MLWLMMAGSVILPAALFAYAAWDDYADVRRIADERMTWVLLAKRPA